MKLMITALDTAPAKASRGFSLVELLVAMALSVVLLFGVINIYTNSKQTYNRQEGLSRLQENARFAMDRFFKQISAAGYMGCLSTTDDVVNVLSDQTGANDFARPIFGTNDDGINGTDTITLARANAATAVSVVVPMTTNASNLTLDTAQAGYAELRQFDVVTVSDCVDAATFMITNNPQGSGGVIQRDTGVTDPDSAQSNASTDLQAQFGATDGTLAVVMKNEPGVSSTTYQINTSTRADGVCSAATPGYCSLYEGNNELVQGVQDMQILYGVDTNGDTQVDAYEEASAGTDWNSVVSVKIDLTVNQVERAQGVGDGETDNIQRTFQTVFRLRSRGA